MRQARSTWQLRQDRGVRKGRPDIFNHLNKTGFTCEEIFVSFYLCFLFLPLSTREFCHLSMLQDALPALLQTRRFFGWSSDAHRPLGRKAMASNLIAN